MNPLDHERFAMMMKLIVWKPMASWTLQKDLHGMQDLCGAFFAKGHPKKM